MSSPKRCPTCGSFQLIPIDDNQLECFSCNEVMEDDRLPKDKTKVEPKGKGKESSDEPSES